MKILQVGKFYPPYRGGMETVLENLVEGLLDSGAEVRTVVSAHGSGERSETILGPRSGRSGQLVRAERLGMFHSQPLNLGLISLLRRQVQDFRPDLVHLHLPNPLALAAWWALPAFTAGPLPPVALWHHADITRQRLGAGLLGPLTRTMYRRCRGISVSSRALAEGSAVLAPYRAKVAVLPFGIDPEPWSRMEPTRDGDFLFVGRLVPYKGLDILLEALARCPRDLGLTVVGEGPEREKLDAALTRPELRGRVRILGSCSPEDLARLMATTRGLVLPSLDSSETFGLVQLEAMAAGVPVIATDLPSGVAEVGIPGENCILVPVGDAPALAETLTTLGAEEDLRRRLGQRGREIFLERYTRDAMTTRVLAWYIDLLGGKESP